jgi:hypothetical protein
MGGEVDTVFRDQTPRSREGSSYHIIEKREEEQEGTPERNLNFWLVAS